jgi:steroid delta-isomerase-like uncharacterized protein
MSEQNKDIVRRYREIHNTNRLDQLDQIMAPDLISHSMFPGLPAGIAGAKASHQFFLSMFPDNKNVTDDLIAEGDKVVERWTNTGTHTGAPFMGVPASGKKYSVTGISIYRIVNGKIVEHWGEFNSVTVFQQLGLMAVPG